MAKYLVETYYTCTFKVNHYLDNINESELKSLEKRDDGKFEVLDVKLDNRKTRSLDPNNKKIIKEKQIEINSDKNPSVTKNVENIVKNADRDGMNFYTVDSIYTSDNNDYYSNRWDKGHMAPAGSFNDSYENLYSTFTFLNAALQYDDLNRGAWVDLEEQVREWADEFGDLDIEIYLEFDTNHIILETEAHVPSAFFKYISFPDGSKKCYYFPNITPDKVWQEYEIDCS